MENDSGVNAGIAVTGDKESADPRRLPISVEWTKGGSGVSESKCTETKVDEWAGIRSGLEARSHDMGSDV